MILRAGIIILFEKLAARIGQPERPSVARSLPLQKAALLQVIKALVDASISYREVVCDLARCEEWVSTGREDLQYLFVTNHRLAAGHIGYPEGNAHKVSLSREYVRAPELITFPLLVSIQFLITTQELIGRVALGDSNDSAGSVAPAENGARDVVTDAPLCRQRTTMATTNLTRQRLCGSNEPYENSSQIAQTQSGVMA